MTLPAAVQSSGERATRLERLDVYGQGEEDAQDNGTVVPKTASSAMRPQVPEEICGLAMRVVTHPDTGAPLGFAR